jgi:putative oxidoreductase
MNHHATARFLHGVEAAAERSPLSSAKVREATRWLVPVARLLFAAIFLISGPNHFAARTIAHAASNGVPAAGLLVPAAGVLSFVGAVMLVLGWRARIGAALLVVFLVPVTLAMHAFWSVADPQMHMMQEIMFWKNVALLGGAFAFLHFGAGPVSFDERAGRTM